MAYKCLLDHRHPLQVWGDVHLLVLQVGEDARGRATVQLSIRDGEQPPVAWIGRRGQRFTAGGRTLEVAAIDPAQLYPVELHERREPAS